MLSRIPFYKISCNETDHPKILDLIKTLKGIFNVFIVSVISFSTVCFSSACSAQSTLQQSLLVLSKADHTLAIVDPSTLKVIARMPVGTDPHEVIASTDGKTAFVSIYGGGSLHEINILDLVGQKPVSNFDTRPLMGPHGLDFMGGKLWFSAEGTKTVGRYDPATNQTDWCMGTGQDRTHMIIVTKDEKTVYTTNVSSATVSILEYKQMAPPRQQSGSPMPGPPPPARSDWIQT
ncbi:MAG: YncE family protein, partial [Chitinophagales bacterium]